VGAHYIDLGIAEGAAVAIGGPGIPDGIRQGSLNSNLLAAVRLDRGLLPLMLAQGAGVIIHISRFNGACRSGRSKYS
jgi:NAD(P)-dependent dehydrogenase (short-subunit alcohol dehydrogenase family)